MALEKGTLTRLSMQRLSKRFSRNKEYDRVDDTSDSRVPLHNEDIFQHGIKFKAKYIGSLEIARPTSKLDIITAMRRIRYEFKVKGVKKRRSLIEISTSSVKVSKRRRRRRRKQMTEQDLFIMEHPIYRIFYVSHDSQDLKIFSYITREPSSNKFRCNVFKAYKKRMALHIVRTLGQAFDVCHKSNPRTKKKKTEEQEAEKKKEAEEKKEEEAKSESTEDIEKAFHELAIKSSTSTPLGTSTPLNTSTSDPFAPGGAPVDLPNGSANLINLEQLSTPFPALPSDLSMEGTDAPNVIPASHMAYVGRPRPRPSQTTIEENKFTASMDSFKGSVSPSASIGEPLADSITELRASEEQSRWAIEKQQLTVQLTLLQEQLQAERSSRIESQARVEHLLLQNKELLSHLQKLMVQIQQIQSLQLAPPSAATPQTSSETTKPSSTPQTNSSTSLEASSFSANVGDTRQRSSSSPPKDSEGSPKQSQDTKEATNTSPVHSSPVESSVDPSLKQQEETTATGSSSVIDTTPTPVTSSSPPINSTSTDKPLIDAVFATTPPPSNGTSEEEALLDAAFSTPTPDSNGASDEKALLDAAFTPQAAPTDGGFSLPPPSSPPLELEELAPSDSPQPSSSQELDAAFQPQPYTDLSTLTDSFS